MLERLGPYVLASPVDGASPIDGAVAIETRNAMARGEHGRPRPVRLDVLRVADALTERMNDRFFEDAKATARLEHDTVVRLLDHGIDAGFAYIVYEPYPHKTLADLLDESESGRLEPELVAAFASDIAAGLNEAHGLRPALVHRGIDPRTVRIGADGRARLHGHALSGLAQGIARARGKGWEHPGYLSPEIVQDGPITERTDQFSLGSTLYTALTGRPAFEGPNQLAASIKLRMGTYDSLDEVAPELPAELRALVAQLLSVEPAKRPLAGTVRDMLSALTRDASAYRKRVAASVRPPPRTPPMPVLKTELMPSISLAVDVPTEPLPDFITPSVTPPLEDAVEPPAVHEKLDRYIPLTFGEVAEPTMLDRPLPAAPVPTSPFDEPTVRDPPASAAFGLATEGQGAQAMPDEVQTDLAITLPPGAEERASLPLVSLPPSDVESSGAHHDPSEAPRESPSESGWPLARVITFGVAAIVVVALTGLFVAWVAS